MTNAGDEEVWTFEDRSSGERFDMALRWRSLEQLSPASAEAWTQDLNKKSCPAGPERDYASGYELAEVGQNLCLYTSSGLAHRGYPIVRFHSFDYEGQIPWIRAEFRRLKDRLSAIEGLKARSSTSTDW